MRSPIVTVGIMAGLLLLSSGCKREIPVLFGTEPINGFRVEGSVSDALGRPLKDVQVRLFYDEFHLESTGPEPSRSYTLQAPNEFIDVQVFNAANLAIRTLFSGLVADTVFTILWDKQMPDGSEAPSGKYTVRYLVGGVERKSYLVLVYGAVSARSDVNGRFVIPEESLPLKQTQIPVYSVADEFLGIYRIGQRVELEFVAGTAIRSAFVFVEEDILTRVNVVL